MTLHVIEIMISSKDAFMHISFAEFGFGFLPSITYGKLVDSLFYSTLSLKRGYIVFFNKKHFFFFFLYEWILFSYLMFSASTRYSWWVQHSHPHYLKAIVMFNMCVG